MKNIPKKSGIYQIAHSHIADCARGERKTAGGYHWEYINGGL